MFSVGVAYLLKVKDFFGVLLYRSAVCKGHPIIRSEGETVSGHVNEYLISYTRVGTLQTPLLRIFILLWIDISIRSQSLV